jgi:hypothetical protein
MANTIDLIFLPSEVKVHRSLFLFSWDIYRKPESLRSVESLTMDEAADTKVVGTPICSALGMRYLAVDQHTQTQGIFN